jgi:peptidyl-prolyl cis-trans isomerase D
VNGVDITHPEFNKQVEEYLQMVKQQYKIEPDENQMTQIREEVWNNMVYEILVKQELSKMGMSVTDQEIRDWVNKLPETLPEQIQKNFVDSTGKINFDFLQQAIQSQEPQVKDFWAKTEEMLRRGRFETKITSLLLSTVRVTDGELMQKYLDDNTKCAGKYVFFDPNLYIPENIVSVGEDEIKNY